MAESRSPMTTRHSRDKDGVVSVVQDELQAVVAASSAQAPLADRATDER